MTTLTDIIQEHPSADRTGANPGMCMCRRTDKPEWCETRFILDEHNAENAETFLAGIEYIDKMMAAQADANRLAEALLDMAMSRAYLCWCHGEYGQQDESHTDKCRQAFEALRAHDEQP